jgi:NAD(P)H dehydrogenase (quinone)
MNQLIAVTGATGGLGRRVAGHLADRGIAQRLLVRDAARAPALAAAESAEVGGYHDSAAMLEALRGVQTLFLVSARESANRVVEHIGVVDAAVEAGVARIIYTSPLGASPNATFTFARDHFATEEHVRKTGLAFTFLRDSLYLELVPMLTSAEGVLTGPAGDGRIAWVARDDIAEVAVAVLTGAGHDGQTYDLTGPEARNLAYAAEQLSKFSGRQVTYRNQSLEEAYASRSSYGAPQFEVDGWVTSYACIATGEMDVVSDTIPRLTGHAAQSLPEFLAAHPDSYAHINQD